MHPGARARLDVVRSKVHGETRSPWTEVAVRMAPWSMQPTVRGWLGGMAEPWIRPLADAEAAAVREGGRTLIFEGPTPNLEKLNCHLSVLESGATPHPPHTHVDEELIVPLRGEVEILRGESFDSPGLDTAPAGPDRLVFHASGQPHTIRAAGPGPATYFVLRWQGRSGRAGGSLPSQTLDLRPHWQEISDDPAPSAKRVLLDEPTALIGKLHVHLTRLAPGAESPEHVDLHDVVMLTLEGEIETLNRRVGPSSAIFHPAHTPHSIRNTGEGVARYLVVEFHP